VALSRGRFQPTVPTEDAGEPGPAADAFWSSDWADLLTLPLTLVRELVEVI
jgi:hypothetical protein